MDGGGVVFVDGRPCLTYAVTKGLIIDTVLFMTLVNGNNIGDKVGIHGIQLHGLFHGIAGLVETPVESELRQLRIRD